MIYLPSHFEAKDAEQAHDLIRANPFATLIGHCQGETLINHLPVLLVSGRLVGHMATRNPRSSIPEGAGVTAVFHGPHAYVTPKWYAGNDVPTWNYAVVHATGKIRWVREAKPMIEILRRMTDFFEAGEREPWRFLLPDDLRKPEDLTGAIIGFEVEIE